MRVPHGAPTTTSAAVLGAAMLAAFPWGAGQCAADVSEAVSDGGRWAMFAAPPALYLLGGKNERQMGRRMADAGLAAVAASELLKLTIHQDRPNNPHARDGFPSGHAAGAWALAEAASMEDHKVRPYAYALAAAVTWARVDTRDHSVFQALSGAALGYALGHASARSHGGLFRGLIVKGAARTMSHEAPTPKPTTSLPGPALVLWEERW